MPLTTQILSFIEDIMIKYGLEDNLIEGDLLLEKKLSEINDLSDRAALKLLFGEKIKEQEMAGKSLEEILPSIRLKRIIESLVDKKTSYSDLPKLIKRDLDVDDIKANEISEAIKNNAEIIKLINQPLVENAVEEDIDEKGDNKEKIDTENKKSIANVLLK